MGEVEIALLLRAGDDLALVLAHPERCPEAMVRSALDDWKDAKRRVTDPYGAHLRDVVEGCK